MESSKLVVKFHAVAPPADFKITDVVPVFHNWIQLHSVPNHLLIDVADYAHVPNGPGILLVSHEANFYLDDLDGKLGLTYSRKQPLPGSFADRVRYAVGAALEACGLLEGSTELAGKLKFATDAITFQINDRLFAPNTLQTFEAVKSDLQKVFNDLFGSQVKLEYRQDNRRLFEVRISAPIAVDRATLLSRLPATENVARIS
jgi:hypothetical protein